MTNERIVIVDGNSLINRAFFAMSDLRNSKGVYTGGVHGLTAMIFNLIDQFKPSHFCVAFDMKGPTKRHEVYSEYKGTRKGMPEELAMQMPIVKEILDALRIPRVELQGYEADDLIGTIGVEFKNKGFDVHVITGDKDALQLVAEGICVHITKKGISQLALYDEALVHEELGVFSNQVIDFKGLSGDSSDNIPGIPGVGPKTAAKLLAEFSTVESLVENYNEISNKRIRELVETYAEQALLSKRLATIFLNVPIEIDSKYFTLMPADHVRALALFSKYELKSLMGRLNNEVVEPLTETSHADFIWKTSVEMADLLKKVEHFQFKVFYDVDNSFNKHLGIMVFGVEGKVYALSPSQDLLPLKKVFESPKSFKAGYNLKNEMLFLADHGINLQGVFFDGYIAAYLLAPSSKTYAFEEVVLSQLNINLESEENILGKGAKRKLFSEIPLESLGQYAADYVLLIERVNKSLKESLESNQLIELYNQVELPLVKVLADIEISGFKVDPQMIDSLDEAITSEIKAIEERIYQSAGESFNINSPKQLGHILFERLGLPPIKKTKTGYSTSHDVLEKLVNKHSIVEDIMSYRTYAKLKSTYIDGLRVVLHPDTQSVHTSLNQTVTVTGRLSSTEPNLQNIPIRLPYGRKIRKIFIADEGCELLAADYSQIELRVLAHLSKDERLVDAFNNDLDIHTITAAQVFGTDEKEVTSAQRSHAKEVNFGIVYGMGDFGLSESLNITRKEAKAYIENYFESYPNVQVFMNEVISSCKKNGYVSTLLGRKREVPDIDHKNFMLRSAAERIARNTPIQGSAADIIKLAMIKVHKALIEGNFKSKMILQVHDELILNVPTEEIEDVKILLRSCMESAYTLNVPLKVDMNTGGSWYEVK